jgi:4-carboxymuconolactone decarboxylase
VSRRNGVTEDELRALPDHRGSDLFSPLEHAVLDYALAMTRTPVEVPDDLHDTLRKELSDEQLVELTAAIAWENYRARFNHAFNFGSEGFSEAAFCPIPARPLEPATRV